jgi:3-dehydroquinate synthase
MITNQWNDLNALIEAKTFDQITILCDSNTVDFCLPQILSLAPWVAKANILDIDAGEESKDLAICEGIWDTFIDYGMNRNSLLVNLGGGVVTDVGGFAASVFMRGIAYVNIPTTLLAAIDAASGGKNGVNFRHKKNYIGTIKQPEMVLIDADFFKTLNGTQLLEGFAEMIKHACIADAAQFSLFQEIDELEELLHPDIILENLAIKQKITQEDPQENGIRKTLNFGHTVAHAFEAVNQTTENTEELSHGLAVAAGIWIESALSNIHQTDLKETDRNQIQALLQKHFDFRVFKKWETTDILNEMRFDKKNTNLGINFSLLKEIGCASINQYPSKEEIEKAFDHWTLFLESI